jgi:hypothetical protein
MPAELFKRSERFTNDLRGLDFIMHALDLDSLLVDIILLAAAVISGISVVTFIVMHKKYVFWRLPTALLWLLVFVTSACLALVLNNLLWDQIYKGQYYMIAGSFIMLIFPAVWLCAIGFFRKDREQRSVWRAAVVVGISLSILMLVWVIGETLL